MNRIIQFLPYYLVWHFTQAFHDSLVIWKNFLWFVWNFFSISDLFKTLFTPWERMTEEYGKSFEDTFGTFIVNTLMRLVGAFVRSTVIIFGLVSWLFVFVAGVGFFIFWFFLPFIIFFLLVVGVISII